MPSIPVTPLEVDIYRHEAVINQTAGSIVFKNSTGRESVSIAHRGGASIVLANGISSDFHPNNKQSNVLGDNYDTVKGNRYNFTFKDNEVRVVGDYNIITGDPVFFNNIVAASYIEKSADIAGVMCSSTNKKTKVGNNTRVEYTAGQNNVVAEMQNTEKELAEIANNMGEGGNLKLLSCKHIYIQAGTVPVGFDTGVFSKDENGRVIDSKTRIVGNALVAVPLPETAYAPQYDEVNTAATIPFGDIVFNAAAKINLQAGAGGVDIKSAGSTKIAGSGLTAIGGAQVMIGAASDTDLGSVYITSKYTELMSAEGNVNIIAGSTHIKTGSLTVTTGGITKATVVIQGDLIVEGDIVATGTINAGKDIVALSELGPVSLLYHTHGVIAPGLPSTPPIPMPGITPTKILV